MSFWEFAGKNSGKGLIVGGAAVGIASAAPVLGNPIASALPPGAGLAVGVGMVAVGTGLELIGGL